MFRSEQRERDLAEELDSHLQLHIDDNLRAGLTPDQARRHALLKLGGVEATKEAYRDRRTVPLLDHLAQDVRFSVRQLRRSPAFASTAILVLALAICASVTIFGFVDAALIKPLPYREPGRLLSLFESTSLGPRFHLSYLDYLDWKQRNTTLSGLEVYENRIFMLGSSAGAQQTTGAFVSAGLFRLLGVTPILGRDFRDGEDLPTGPRLVMLSHDAWQTRYGGRPGVLGETVTLDGEPHAIVGVLPRGFHFAPAEPADFWAVVHERCADQRGCHNLQGVARLTDGVSIEAATADITAIARQLAREYPDTNRDRGATVLPLSDVVLGDVRPILLVLLGGAALLLLIACVNIASLLLVRAESRRREMAVRGALGASRGRLLRQFFTEGVVLAAVGGVLGVASAQAAMPLLTSLIPAPMKDRLPFLGELGLNPRVALFAGAIVVSAAILFALMPALRLARGETRDGLNDGARGSAGTFWRRFGANLVIVELATAVVLLVGAGLLGQSFYRLITVETGFQPDRLATLRLAALQIHYPTDERLAALQRQLIARFERVPGVTAVGLANQIPVGDGGGTSVVRAQDQPDRERIDVNRRFVSAGYFAALGARFERGRAFTSEDTAATRRVTIVNQRLARQLFGNGDPIGRRLFFDGAPETMLEIVGVVSDIKEGPLDAATYPAVYVPFEQEPTRRFSLIVRASGQPHAVLPTLSAAVQEIDPNLAVFAESVMSDRIHDSASAYLRRSSAWLVGGFAAVALLLGIVGLYGVIAYSVSQRTRELGIRIALGARPRSVYRLVLTEAGRLAATGIVAGLTCAIASASLLQRLLFGIHSLDVPTFGAVALVLAVCALLASYIPARRAASVNPIDALRAD